MSYTLLPPVKDIAVIWSNKTGSGDIALDQVDQDVLLDNPLFSAVLVSLFSDRLAPDILNSVEKNIGFCSPGNVTNAFQRPRKGWWADSLSGDKIGSRLWQLQRAVKAKGSSVLLEVQAIVYEALEWMVAQKIAENVHVVANFVKDNAKAVAFTVQISQPKNASTENFTFQLAWKNL